jgi:hypothetical protein
MAGALVACWICFSLSIFIMACRLLGAWRVKKKLDAGDFLTLGAMFVALPLMACLHVIIIWQTNNMPRTPGLYSGLSLEDIRHREIGSKVTLAGRCLYDVM